MKSGWRLLATVALLVAGLASGWSPSLGTTALAQDVGDAEVAPNRFIVRLKPGITTTAQSAARTYDNLSGVTIDQVYDSAIYGFAGEFTIAAVDRLIDDPNVLDIRPDRKTYLADQRVPRGIRRVDADFNPTRAGNGSGDVDVDIAVLDTGIYQHPDLNVVGGKDCANTARSGPYNDISGHGTHVAGTAAARDNDTGVVGVAPGARLWAVKIFSDDQWGAAYESEVMCGLNFVRQNASTIEVINMSIGANYGYDLGPCWADAYHQAYCNTVASGVPIVVAAQNWTINARVVVPAQFDEVITVSAYYDADGKRGGLGEDSDCKPRGGVRGVQKDDTFACFSNYGPDIDISAPGMDVYSTFSARANPDDCPTADYCYMSGTSMATPHVAGAVGLIAAQQGRMSPAATKARLLLTAEKGPVPLDPDGIYEPMLNVAQLGKGEMVAPRHAKVGERVTIEVSGYTPGERAVFRWDGDEVGDDTVDSKGDASRTFTMPATSSMNHPMVVTTGQRTITKMIDINPSIALDVTSGPVRETVNVKLRGFGTAESVLITFETGAGVRNLVRVRVSDATGSANTTFVVPASTDGKHRVSATGNKSSSTYTNFVTKPSASLASGTPAPNALVRLQMLGFSAGEGVEARFDVQSGPVLGSVTLSATGSGSLSVRIPSTATPGNHYIWLIGNDGNRIRVSLSVGSAGLPTPEPSATATATGEIPTEPPATKEPTDVVSTETPEPSATSTETAEPSVTETPTGPTETATTVAVEPTATEEAAEEATVVP